METKRHKIINIQVSQGEFDVINKWCHADDKETCLFLMFVSIWIMIKPIKIVETLLHKLMKANCFLAIHLHDDLFNSTNG